MKMKDLAIVVAGFFLLGTGMAMLTLSSTSEEAYFVFVLPFVIPSGLGSVATAIILAITLGFAIWFVKGLLDLVPIGRFEDGTHLHTRYLRVDSLCDICESPLPLRASFCPSCGKPIDGLQRKSKNED
jgi:hypothetical protein